MTVTVTVLYPPGKFDLDYYLNKHIPLVAKVWGPKGMKDWRVVKNGPGPDGADAPYQIACVITFDSAESLQAALTDPGSKEVFEDPKNYTDEVSRKAIFLAGETVASG
ncbi:uncharacterized protein PV09_00727 [Verruconis gallopava]|uniref:EthD domain-containing protein n=1 Tax=Verruconis gallopava TaxID=253628 RepID=A0A0D2AQ21_9PEZI|nr:uncharacterized protein PV09_00727 [Verruconis gallopava]KIW08793.1 hypothetical protein PV09_00727 [Verruconis gallopava]